MEVMMYIIVAIGIILGISGVIRNVNASKKERFADKHVKFIHSRIKEIEKERDAAIEGIRTRIEKEVVERTNELNATAQLLDTKWTQMLIEKRGAQRAFEEGREAAIWASNEMAKVIEIKRISEQLIHDGKRAIKQNKHELFEVREATLYLYDHYKFVVEALAAMLEEAESQKEYSDLCMVLGTANTNLTHVKQRFVRDFNQTPEEYSSHKIKLSGKKASGEEWTSEFSKN